MSEKLKIEEEILIKAGREFIKKNPFLTMGIFLSLGFFLGYFKGEKLIKNFYERLPEIVWKKLINLITEK